MTLTLTRRLRLGEIDRRETKIAKKINLIFINELQKFPMISRLARLQFSVPIPLRAHIHKSGGNIDRAPNSAKALDFVDFLSLAGIYCSTSLLQPWLCRLKVCKNRTASRGSAARKSAQAAL
jgi:hypothetical protein